MSTETKETRQRSRGNGEGTIYFSEAKGKWVAQYTIGVDELGKQKRKTFYGDRRKDVKKKLDDFVTQLKTDNYFDKSIVTLHQLAKESVEYDYKMNIVSPNSYLRKKATLAQLDGHSISQKPIQAINERDIKNFFVSITKYSNSVIGKIYSMLNNALKRAVVLKIISTNPLDDTRTFSKPKSSKQTKKVSALTINDQKKLISLLLNNEKKSNYRCQMFLSMYTGMRMGEINALTLNDISFKDKLIHVSKTLTRDENDKTIPGKSTKTYAGIRDVYLNDFLLRLLQEHIDHNYVENSEQLIFYDKKKIYITTSQVNMQFKRLCEKHNISKGYEVNQHMLRHTFATRCIEADVPPKVLQKMLGHADIKTTLDTYCDVFEEYQQKHTNNVTDYLTKKGLLID